MIDLNELAFAVGEEQPVPVEDTTGTSPAEVVAILPALPALRARRLGELILETGRNLAELLKHRFLSLGGGMLLVGPTGVGKSALAMQMKILWALGRAAFGIEPTRPLKSLLVQAENDDGDLVEMRDGVIQGLKLSDADRDQAYEMVMVVDEDPRTGAAFIKEVLRPLLKAHRPDLLWIDPALAYLDGDASSQRDVGRFLRNLLNPLLREFGCACIILHHTNKPATGRDKPDSQPANSAYLGSGSIEWANWARCVVVLQNIGSPKVFELRAAKRGARLKWKDADGKTPTFIKFIAHGEADRIYWREPALGEIPKKANGKSLPTKADVLALVPAAGSIPKNGLRNKANAAGIALNRINPLIDELIADGSLIKEKEKREGTHARIILVRPPVVGEVAV
jgi:hypothetical protein